MTVFARCLLVCLIAPAAFADVTLQEAVRVEGSGLLSMGNMTINTTTRISGNKARTDNDMQMKSGMMRMLAGSGPTAQIVRLGQDQMYDLNIKKKRYTQTSFAAQRAEMEKAMAEAEKAQSAQTGAIAGVDEESCEWSPPTSQVERKGEKATIAGMQAERLKITASQSCTDRKTGSVCDFALMLDQWLAPSFPAQQETEAYHRAYAEKLGLGATGSADFAQRAQQSFGRYQGIWTEIGKQLKDVKGYPVRSSFALGIGGPKCQSSAPAAGDQPQRSTSENVGQVLGGALGGALGGMFGKKKAEAEQPAAQAAPPAPATVGNGLVPLMSVSSELISVNMSPVAGDVFEVPADFKLQK